MRRDAEELFDVFDMWSELETEPWEAPPTPPRPVSVPVLAVPHVTPSGALEPATVIQDPPSMHQKKRRIGPRIPPPAPEAEPGPDPERSPVDFLRKVGIPEIGRAVERLEAVDHQVQIQDLLDLEDPALRVLFWPRPGPMTVNPERQRATLEVTVLQDERSEVTARYWMGRDSEEPVSLGQVPLEVFDLTWVRSRVLDFIEAVLGQA